MGGEEKLDIYFQKFSDEYIVFRDLKIPPNKWNIDFAVLGPTGLFMVEAKSHNGFITYDGKILLKNGRKFEKNILGIAKSSAYELSEYIEKNLDKKFYVRPVVVFSNIPRLSFGSDPVEGVYVVGLEQLEGLLKSFRYVKWNFDKKKVEEVLANLVQIN